MLEKFNSKHEVAQQTVATDTAELPKSSPRDHFVFEMKLLAFVLAAIGLTWLFELHLTH